MATTSNAFVNIGKGTRLQDPTWIRNQISSYLRHSGVNTDTNPFAQSSMERAPQVASLMDLYGVDANNSERFINQWATGQGWGNQQAGGGGDGWDFSNQGIQNQINRLSAAGNDNSILRTGDADADISTMREFQALANANKTNRWQKVADANEVRKGNQFREQFLDNPGAGGWYSEYRQFGTPLTNGQPGGPAPVAGQPPAGTPPAGTPPAGTPPAGTPPAGTPPAGTPPAGPPQAGQPQAQWLAWLKSMGATVDANGTLRGNPLWSTQGYNSGMTGVGDPNAFKYGNMSGTHRNTRRGDPAGVFAYRLAQLMNQRRRPGGNAALGITSATTDDQIAQLAMQFVNTNMKAGGGTQQLRLVNGRPVLG